MKVKLKCQDKFYDIVDHNKCLSCEKSAEKCILRKSYFHHSEPTYTALGKTHANNVMHKLIRKYIFLLTLTRISQKVMAFIRDLWEELMSILLVNLLQQKNGMEIQSSSMWENIRNQEMKRNGQVFIRKLQVVAG